MNKGMVNTKNIGGILAPREKPKSIGKWVALSFQHIFAMFGANVLVPIVINQTAGVELINISMALFCSGLGTLVYIALTAAKVPIYLGSSFAYMTVIGTGYSNWGNSVFIAIFLAGFVYIIAGIIIHFTSNKWLLKLFSPIIVGPIIMIIGLGAIPSALKNVGIVNNWITDSNLDQNTNYPQWIAIVIGLIVFLTAAILMLKAKGFLKIIPILGALIFGYLICALIQLSFPNIRLINSDKIKNFSSWSWYPNFKNIFNVNKNTITPAIISIVPIAFVTMVEHYGDHVNIGNMTNHNFIEDPGIGRTLIADGVSISLAGLIGGPANTTYAENTSVVAITKIASVWVTGLAAIIAVLMSFIAPLNQVISITPKPVLGGISMLLFGIIATNGVRIMINGKVNLNDAKALIIISIVLGVGLGMTMSGTTISIGNFQITGLLLATFLGLTGNMLLPSQKNTGFFNIKIRKNKRDQNIE